MKPEVKFHMGVAPSGEDRVIAEFDHDGQTYQLHYDLHGGMTHNSPKEVQAELLRQAEQTYDALELNKKAQLFGMPIARVRVYEAFNTERDYQDELWGKTVYGRPVSGSSGYAPEAGGNRTIDEFALYIQRYANALTDIAGSTGDAEAKLHAVRKVGALAVACMEQHGAPKRTAKSPGR